MRSQISRLAPMCFGTRNRRWSYSGRRFPRPGRRLSPRPNLAADASVNVYFLCDLPVILERFGNRGYRAAQLEAGILGGRMYLAAYAQGFGATGLTFFDDEVTHFFSPHAAEKSVMFLIAMGHAGPRQRAHRV